MENATKALLIAAAVLIAIVLIGVGIKILSSTSGVTERVDSVSEAMASSTFNSQFLCFVSNSTSGSQAKALVSRIISNNSAVSSSTSFSATKHQVYVNLYPLSGANSTHQWKASGLQKIYQKISDTSKYKISVTTTCDTFSGGYYNGYIVCMTIREIN